MGISNYLKEIGRGSAGARSLSAAQAEDLMAQVLDRSASDIEIGAFALAMRMKGETADELTGFLAATHARCQAIRSTQPVILLPSYNGARRLPNLTPLLALLLAQQGARVLVHGPLQDPKRIASAAILHDLGLAAARTQTEVEQAWTRNEPAFMAIDVLSPPLARLLDVRWIVGLRNSGHTVAKMLAPVVGAPALRVVNHTHPEFGALLATYARDAQASMALLRGTEGEPVADARRLPRIDTWLHGEAQPAWSCAAQEGPLAMLPLLPCEIDATTTARYIQAVASGAQPVPGPIARQVELLLGALSALGMPAAHENAA